MTLDALKHRWRDAREEVRDDGIWLRHSTSTPAASYHYVAWSANRSGRALLCVHKGSPDWRMAERAAEIAAGVTAADMPSPVIVLAATDLGAFDHVVCFRDDVHQFFSGEAGLAKAIVVAPAHRVEFTGRETVDEAIAIRRSIVTTIDFARPPMPVIRCAYANATTLEKSRRKAPLPAVWSSIHSALDSLITSDGWMALEGPNGVRADLAFSIAAPGVEAIVDGTTTLVPRGSLEGWILTTLT